MNHILQNYITLVEFLGKVLGPQYEVVLHDLSTDDYSIAAIANGHVSGRTVGAPLTGMALKFVIERIYLGKNYEVNYCGKSKKGTTLRSSTMFIKDDEDKLIGMLCINYDQNKCQSIIEDIQNLFQLQPQTACALESTTIGALGTMDTLDSIDSFETFPESIADMIESILHSIIQDPNISRERLTQKEKLQIVDALHQKGVFLLKGAVSETAEQLRSSEATIYRYLNKINKQRPHT